MYIHIHIYIYIYTCIHIHTYTDTSLLTSQGYFDPAGAQECNASRRVGLGSLDSISTWFGISGLLLLRSSWPSTHMRTYTIHNN